MGLVVKAWCFSRFLMCTPHQHRVHHSSSTITFPTPLQRPGKSNSSMDDKSVCSFYQKIGACRHGEKCSRRHIRPTESKTVLLANLYQNPKVQDDADGMTEAQTAGSFDHFYADIFKRLAQEGVVDQVVVCENENFHLSGNVYVRFNSTESAAKAVMLLNLEWYEGKPVYCELSPVTSFHEANCRAHDTNTCTRGDHCNFMHVRKPTLELRGKLRNAQEKLIALSRLREARGDASWGKQWEAATTSEYTREPVKAETKTEQGNKADEKEEDDEEKEPPTTTTEAVARLFA